MPNPDDPYAVLGVARNASADDIRAAYRKLARKYHPDVNPGDAAAENRFKEISGAYEVLSDPEKRRAHDEFGSASRASGFDPARARAYQQWRDRREQAGRPFEREMFDFDLGDIFGGATGRRRRARGADIRAVAELDLAQVVRGTEVEIQRPTGPTRVRIPPGAEDGSTLRIRGKGAPAVPGGPAGDLIIETRVKPHPRVRRDGLNLSLSVPVTLAEAYAGASIEVPTFDGPVMVKVPPRSQNGARLRLRGKGIPRKDRRGDFFIELDVRLPERDDEALAEALQAASSLYEGDLREEVKL